MGILVQGGGTVNQIVLFGAGSAGGYVLRHLRARGVEPVAVVDSDSSKWGQTIGGCLLRDAIDIPVTSPTESLERFPDAEWVACAISRPAATEIRAQLKSMGVKTKPLWECLPVCHGLPPESTFGTIAGIAGDEETVLEWIGQCEFRENPNYDRQRPPSDINEIYFPDFIKHRDDESFCGRRRGRWGYVRRSLNLGKMGQMEFC